MSFDDRSFVDECPKKFRKGGRGKSGPSAFSPSIKPCLSLGRPSKKKRDSGKFVLVRRCSPRTDLAAQIIKSNWREKKERYSGKKGKRRGTILYWKNHEQQFLVFRIGGERKEKGSRKKKDKVEGGLQAFVFDKCPTLPFFFPLAFPDKGGEKKARFKGEGGSKRSFQAAPSRCTPQGRGKKRLGKEEERRTGQSRFADQLVEVSI